MIQKNILLTFIICCLSLGCVNRTKILKSKIVFKKGENNYKFFRIPALLKAEGNLYAFAEARRESLHDNGDIDLVLKISQDEGNTWGELKVIQSKKEQSIQSPVPVYITSEKKILLLYIKKTNDNDTEHQILSGTSKGHMEVYQIESFDFGKTWSSEREITNQVKNPKWNWNTIGSGGAIVLKNEKYKNRIVIPGNHSIANLNNTKDLSTLYGAHLIYSDDNGKSWEIGAIDDNNIYCNPNENTVVELESGIIYSNARNQNTLNTIDSKDIYGRCSTYSKDGGKTYTRPYYLEKQLITPQCHSSLLSKDNILFFIAPSNRIEREDLSLWISYDYGSTWIFNCLIYENKSAYSSSVFIGENRIGILYETGINLYDNITYVCMNLDY